LYGRENWSVTLQEEHRLCSGEYMALITTKWWETEEDYIVRSFITTMLHQI